MASAVIGNAAPPAGAARCVASRHLMASADAIGPPPDFWYRADFDLCIRSIWLATDPNSSASLEPQLLKFGYDLWLDFQSNLAILVASSRVFFLLLHDAPAVKGFREKRI
jgi:hypothetical protein